MVTTSYICPMSSFLPVDPNARLFRTRRVFVIACPTKYWSTLFCVVFINSFLKRVMSSYLTDLSIEHCQNNLPRLCDERYIVKSLQVNVLFWAGQVNIFLLLCLSLRRNSVQRTWQCLGKQAIVTGQWENAMETGMSSDSCRPVWPKCNILPHVAWDFICCTKYFSTEMDHARITF